MPSVLEADGIVAHRGGRAVLTAAALRLAPATITAVTGRNGAGKSTLLTAIAGVAPPTSGRVRIADVIKWKWSLSQVAELGLFFWPQQGFLSRHLSIDAQLSLMQRRWNTPDAVCETARNLLPESVTGAKSHELSPGERKLVETAIIHVRQPRILLADEPFAGLAPNRAEALGAQLRALAHAGTAVCFTSHEWWLVDSIADLVVYCVAGTTHDLGAPADAARNHPFRRDFLGPSPASRSRHG